jgi:hypothetical protein
MLLKPGAIENPSLWRKIHNLWISEIHHSLKPQVKGRLTISLEDDVSAMPRTVGVEDWSREVRHHIVLQDLSGENVVAILEVLSATNKGFYASADGEAFRDRRQRLLSSSISYMEIDAVPAGTRWLPRSLQELSKHAGVVWTSVPCPSGERHFEGWAWAASGPLPCVPWDLGRHGGVEVDLEWTFGEAAATAGLAAEPSPLE